jgi:hypothetical protein
MSAQSGRAFLHPILRDIQAHSAWYGRISGLAADKMLRNRQIPFLYLLREGERQSSDEMDYYISFLLSSLEIRHHPFRITITSEGWYYDDISPKGPFTDPSITSVLHLMMQCRKEDCVPLNRIA